MADSSPSSSDDQKLIDRLSDLPEHIILRILSFLPTNMAVATSVLSKPWQHLWTLVPAIDLYYVSCPKTSEYSLLISKVLDGNKAPIMRRFRVGGRSCTTSYLDKWLSYATERNVEELDLNFQDVYGGDVLSCSRHSTFVVRFAPDSCKTLVVMKVMMNYLPDLRFLIDALYFPSLKILHLKGVGFISKEPSLSGFFSSRFPLLEELVIYDCSALHHDLNISLPKLRRLEIQYIKKYTLDIEAPSLQYLLLCCGTRDFRVENLLINLVEANVDVFYEMRGRDYEESLINKDDEYGESLINFVNALSNVRMLNLSHSTIETLSSHSLSQADRIQPFHNLVELDLQLDGSLLGITMIMLSKFVNLEHIKVHTYKDHLDKTTTEYCLAPPTQVPNFLTYHLKTFCIEDFSCSKHEMEFTIYILKNSLVLENVKIIFRPRLVWKKGYDSKKILSKTPRGSLECKLEFDQKVSEFEDIDSYSDYS